MTPNALNSVSIDQSSDSSDAYHVAAMEESVESPRGRRQTTQGKRAKYIGRACHDCQRRKVKCSGEEPCLNCRVRGKVCIYLPQGRRGRKQRKLSSSGKRKPMASPSPGLRSTDPRCERRAPPLGKPPLQNPGLVHSTTVPPAWDEETDAYNLLKARPKSISLSSQLLCLRQLAHPNGTEQVDPPRARIPFRDRVFSVELPRPAKLNALLDVYFRDLDSFFPFLERDETQARIQATLGNLGYADNQHIIDVDCKDSSIISLLCNMLAIAEGFSQPEPHADEIRPGWSIFLRGRKLNQHCLSLAQIDLYLVQYHALSAEYLMQSELLHDASQAISNAAQLAMLAQLNNERAWEPLPPAEVRSRKKLWWTIYFLDRRIAQRTGSPYVIRDTEVAVSDFSTSSDLPYETARTDHYMQALVSLAKLWSQIWDSFFAAATSKPLDWREIEVMDTRILVAQRELPNELAWETDLLERVYLAQGETEPHIRRRLAIFIRLNLLRLMIRQNPLQQHQATQSRRLCASLAAQTVDAIAAFAESCPSIVPCGFFFSTALLECIYHLILAIRDTPTQAERLTNINQLQLAYQLLDQFSQTLDTARRAIRALDSVVSFRSGSNSLLSIFETSNDSPLNSGFEDHPTTNATVPTMESTDLFDQIFWQMDDISFDALAPFSFSGAHGEDEDVANTQLQLPLEPGPSLWSVDYGMDMDGGISNSPNKL